MSSLKPDLLLRRWLLWVEADHVRVLHRPIWRRRGAWEEYGRHELVSGNPEDCEKTTLRLLTEISAYWPMQVSITLPNVHAPAFRIELPNNGAPRHVREAYLASRRTQVFGGAPDDWIACADPSLRQSRGVAFAARRRLVEVLGRASAGVARPRIVPGLAWGARKAIVASGDGPFAGSYVQVETDRCVALRFDAGRPVDVALLPPMPVSLVDLPDLLGRHWLRDGAQSLPGPVVIGWPGATVPPTHSTNSAEVRSIAILGDAEGGPQALGQPTEVAA